MLKTHRGGTKESRYHAVLLQAPPYPPFQCWAPVACEWFGLEKKTVFFAKVRFFASNIETGGAGDVCPVARSCFVATMLLHRGFAWSTVYFSNTGRESSISQPCCIESPKLDTPGAQRLRTPTFPCRSNAVVTAGAA